MRKNYFKLKVIYLSAAFKHQLWLTVKHKILNLISSYTNTYYMKYSYMIFRFIWDCQELFVEILNLKKNAKIQSTWVCIAAWRLSTMEAEVDAGIPDTKVQTRCFLCRIAVSRISQNQYIDEHLPLSYAMPLHWLWPKWFPRLKLKQQKMRYDFSVSLIKFHFNYIFQVVSQHCRIEKGNKCE